MKKILFCLMVMMLLTGCSPNNSDSKGNTDSGITNDNIKNSEQLTNENEDGKENLEEFSDANMIEEDELREYIQEVAVTTDNWLDFYELVESENIETDAFGDFTGNEEYLSYYKPLEGCMFSEDFAIKINYDIVEWDCYYDTEEDLSDAEHQDEPRNREDVFEGYSNIDVSHIRKMYMSTNVEGQRNYYYFREHRNFIAIRAQGLVTKTNIPENEINVSAEGLSYYVVRISNEDESLYVYYPETMTCHTYKNGERIGGAAYDEAEFWRMMYEMIR